jgi:hypothetical protein
MAMMIRRTLRPKIRTLAVRLLFIEPSPNHHETLLALIGYAAALPEPKEISVAAPPAFQKLYESLAEVQAFQAINGSKTLPDLLAYIRQQNFTHLIHNTAYGPFALRVAWQVRQAVQVGIVHDTEKLHRCSAAGWGVALRLDHFWVLRQRLWERLPLWWRKKSRPFRLATLPPSLLRQIPSIPKPSEERWFAIPGRIEFKRRSYLDLVEALSSTPPPKGWRFLLLGPAEAPYSDWPFLRRKLEETGLLPYFVSFPEGLDFATYHGYLRACEAVLPLIHPTTPYWKNYRSYQIAGAFSLAFTHKKPLLLHKTFADEPDLRDASWFYESPRDLLHILQQDKEALPSLYQNSYWDKEIGIEVLRCSLGVT